MMNFELALVVIAAGGAGAGLGYLVGLSVGMRKGDRLSGAPRIDRPAEVQPAPQRYEPPPPPAPANPQADFSRPVSPPPRVSASATPPAPPRVIPPLPIVDNRPNEDRTVFRKLKSAQAAFHESLTHLKGTESDESAAETDSPREKTDKR